MSEQAIVLNELTKHYGKHRGINNLSFSVNQGEFFGFIGPNGAGKSTTIRTLMGLIRPTGGSASIFDYAPTATTKRELKSVIIQYLKIFRYTVRSANGK